MKFGHEPEALATDWPQQPSLTLPARQVDEFTIMTVCKRVHYWGRVQGVGFRMTTLRIARQYAVTGYVRNLPDGQVEVLVVGTADEIARFLDAVAGRLASNIEGHRIEDEPSQEFAGFDIR